MLNKTQNQSCTVYVSLQNLELSLNRLISILHYQIVLG